jgi:hypothetical protein
MLEEKYVIPVPWELTLEDRDNKQNNRVSGGLWFTPVILATQEAEIRRIVVQSQPRQIHLQTHQRECCSLDSGRKGTRITNLLYRLQPQGQVPQVVWRAEE